MFSGERRFSCLKNWGTSNRSPAKRFYTTPPSLGRARQGGTRPATREGRAPARPSPPSAATTVRGPPPIKQAIAKPRATQNRRWVQGRKAFGNKLESIGILEIPEVANAYVITIEQRDGNVAIVEQIRTNYIVVSFGNFAKVDGKGIVVGH